LDEVYLIDNTAELFTPSLVFYTDLIRRNIRHAIDLAGNAGRLRPHVKTHKTREIVRLELKAGITKHKCATLAEAEMLASCGASEVFLAYNMVGPNGARLARLAQAYPTCRFSTTADDSSSVQDLSAVMTRLGQTVEVLIDLDVGQHRTGMPAGEEAAGLYEQISKLAGLRPGGIHVYDGHNHQQSAVEREQAVTEQMQMVLAFRDQLERRGLQVPRIVAGGTPTFPIYARMHVAGLECAPGTCFLNDAGYSSRFADLTGFKPAALLLTRVISRPISTRVTLDIGTKAVASDPPAGKRLVLLNVPNYEPVIHNEEHFVIETEAASNYRPGDLVYAMPTHICPTCALHRQAYVVEKRQVTGCWDIVARDRVLTV
jgi:D-serine deaminase-like pyridoxal phosphate-dependent protein